jgi:hypothetical protein
MTDVEKIEQVIARFANSFDLKDWNGLQSCFTETIYTDYSDLRRTPPETVTAKEYVKLRRAALDHLKLHHLVGNLEINFLDPSTATCRASMVIWRKSEAEDFITHCVYVFQLLNANEIWRISEITQKVLWSEGTPAIHKGTI